MSRVARQWLLALATVAGIAVSAAADEIVLKDGMVLEGTYVELPSIVITPPRGGEDDAPIPKPIIMIDDELRRIFFHQRHVADVRAGPAFSQLERFEIPQRFSRQAQIEQLGPPMEIKPFDEFGRRIYSMRTAQGQLDVIQGITEINPRCVKVQALDYYWEMRLATASIPEDQLDRMLERVIDRENADHRLRLASFYNQARRYRRAQEELEAIPEDFPETAAQVDRAWLSIKQTQAREVLAELRLRQKAAQHRFVVRMLENFPQEDISSAILQEVRAIREQYQKAIAQSEKAVEQLQRHLGELSSGQRRDDVAPLCEEIIQRLNIENVDRLEAFLALADDPELKPAEKLALAITGWLMGSDAAETNLDLAIRLWQARQHVIEYLWEDEYLQRQELLSRLRNVEGIGPDRVARIIPRLWPPLHEPDLVPEQTHRLRTPTGDPDAVEYLVQLPPEYLPDHRYPAVITLRGATTTCQMQIDWWVQHASRHGYIVIAPEYAQTEQKQYGFSAEEHAAVLATLRDALKRFQIDSDRVFLSGHSMGGVAAWDIGLSHPHLFAGVIPIVGYPDKYCIPYRENAVDMPFYVVGGQLDRDLPYRVARELDHWLAYTDARYVEYRGRGHEHFLEESPQIFDWMDRRRRSPPPTEFSCWTLRPSDNRFYWLTLGELPPAVVLPPSLYGKKQPRPMLVEGRISPAGSIDLRGTGSGEIDIWLSPDLVDFQQRLRISIHGYQRYYGYLSPDLEDMMEDVRVRGDRQQFFWKKFSVFSGR